MNIALIGYGKMGKEIETIALKRKHKIVLHVEKDNSDLVTEKDLKKADVAIEFTTPGTVVDNLTRCMEAGLPVVVGTTGWYDHFAEIEHLCLQKKGGLFHATNYSVGVNLFFKVNKFLAELMNKYEEYDVNIEEIHHIHKLDKPSGTAITLASQIIENLDRKNKWSLEEKGKDILNIKDIREGEVPGTHIIKYQSEVDNIEIMHRANNRKGFALGAVLAAEFLKGKAGIYTMSDII
ncbi:MAG: 4-hydroxy-tetrahydrodipicolinate reductase [Bacteroidetes bacterium]|nr:4-hydroxy-tetrahydrodipicolinate reductase [Bacteroidota bacterium]